jgi:nucleosome assembly protein 1-like 1
MTDEAPLEANSTSGGDPQDPMLSHDLNEAGADTSLMDHDEDEDDEDDEDDEEENMLQDLPPAVLARVERLQELHQQREALMQEYLKERAALEQKYRQACLPLYQQRAQIVQEDAGEEPKGIPQFWVCAMGHMDTVADLLTEADVDCLEYMVDLECIDFQDGQGFELIFHFRENPYFNNNTLTKRYHVPNLLLDEEPLLKNVEGCDIDWKSPDQCLTQRTVTKKQRGRGKHAGQIRSVKKVERQESFFHFFSPPKLPSYEQLDEDEADRLEEAFDADYEVAQAIRSNLVPKAIAWFTGQADDDDIVLVQHVMGEMTVQEHQEED